MDYLAKINELEKSVKYEKYVNLPSFCKNVTIYAKVENENLTGSIKDRAVLYMVKECAQLNLINRDTIFIEATSGNTGISISYIANYLHLKSLIIMPSSMSKKRRDLIKKYHGDLLLIEGGMKECEEKLNNLLKSNKNYINLSQFNNPNNTLSHYFITGPQIASLPFNIDYVIAGIGTGGTISGIGKYFKEKKLETKIIGVEPYESPLLTFHKYGKHHIEGLGANFIPKILDLNVIDEILDIKSSDAILTYKKLKNQYNINVGISSGAVYYAALEVSKRVNKATNIVVIFPDSGDRYE